MTQTVNPPIAGSYPGGDTSQTMQIRATYVGPLVIPVTTETLIPLFTTVEAGAINLSVVDAYTLSCNKAGTIIGALDFNVHTTGSNIIVSTWFETSVDLGVTWIPVPNSLRQTTVVTDATISTGSTLIGILPKGTYTRCKMYRTGGTSCQIQTDTLVTSNGNVTQPATLIRIYGI